MNIEQYGLQACMRSLPTLTVCALYASIIKLVSVSLILLSVYHYLLYRRAFALAQLSVLENVGLTLESNGTNRFESIFWRESNRIEIIFGESECTIRQ